MDFEYLKCLLTGRHKKWAYIYAIQSEDGKFTKFGQTLNWKNRFKSLQNTSPFKLVPKVAIWANQEVEGYLLSNLSYANSSGEWFFTDALINKTIDFLIDCVKTDRQQLEILDAYLNDYYLDQLEQNRYSQDINVDELEAMVEMGVVNNLLVRNRLT